MAPILGVKVKLGGQDRVLRYDQHAIYALEQESGLTMPELAERLARGSFIAASQLVWAGLLHADKRLTVAQVVPMIDLRDQDTLAAALKQAMDQAFGPEVEASEEGKAPAA